MTYIKNLLSNRLHTEDCERHLYDARFTDEQLLKRIEDTIAAEQGNRKINQIIEDSKEGLKITEEQFYNLKLFKR